MNWQSLSTKQSIPIIGLPPLHRPALPTCKLRTGWSGRRLLWLFAPLLKLWDQIYLCMSQLAVILFFVKRNTRPYLAPLCLESCQKQWFEMYLFFGLRRPHSRTETGTNLPPITSLFVLNGKQISHFTATILSKQNWELSPLSWVSPTKQDSDLSGHDFIRIIG